MGKSRQKSSGMTVGDMAVLAGNVGLVANDDQGRQAFLAWWGTDEKACRAALFSRVEARRIAAAKAKASTPRTITAAEAQAGRSGEPTTYPASWSGKARGAAASVRAAVAAGQTLAVVDPQYPAEWLRAAVPAGQVNHEGGITVVKADD
jgi:hypothetical protein